MNKKIIHEEIASYPLSDSDLRKILGDDISIVLYPELDDIDDIDEVFDDKGRAMILFLTTDAHTGHWMCIYKRDDGIHFFDPYGTAVDKARDWLSKEKLIELQQEKPFLRKLLLGSGEKVYYNIFPFQQDKMDINTCGRHCSTRLLYKDLDLDEYYNMIRKSKLSPDDFVSIITFEILNK